ncbi:MAG: multidrug efflux MFS transporter [Chloroflexi bacterium]|nr:MAG: multidrug efflux MFS transporter [Chloroflexota bacterium]
MERGYGVGFSADWCGSADRLCGNRTARKSIGVYSGSIFLFPLFFERVRGDSAVLTGLFLISPGLATGAGVIIAGPLYNRLGPRILTTFGMFLLICGTYGLTQITLNTTGQELQIWLILRGLGLGFAYQPLQTLGLSVVSKEGMAKASSLINMTRQVATAMAVATVSTYLTQQVAIYRIAINDALQTGLQTHQFTSVAAACVQAVGSIQNMTALNACAGQQALANGMADTFWIILILSAACIPLALAIKGNVASLAAKGDTATLTANSDPAVLSTKGDMTALALKGDAAVLTLKSDSAVLALKGDLSVLTLKTDAAVLTLKSDPSVLTLDDSEVLTLKSDSAVLTLKSDSAVLTLKSEPEIKTPETRQAADRELEESTARAASARD